MEYRGLDVKGERKDAHEDMDRECRAEDARRAMRIAGACAALLLCLAGIYVVHSCSGVSGFAPEMEESAGVLPPAAPEADERISRLEEEMRRMSEKLSAPAAVTYRFFDLDRLMKMSLPGKDVLDYNRRYVGAADKAIAEIDALIKNGTADADRLGTEKARLSSLKTKVVENSNRFFRELVKKALADYPLGPDVVLAESSHVYSLPSSADFTAELAGRMSYIKPQLPDVPEFKVSAPVLAKQPAEKAAGVKQTVKKGTVKKAQGSGKK